MDTNNWEFDASNSQSTTTRLTPPDLLRAAAKTFEERNHTYGAVYRGHGDVMMALFPCTTPIPVFDAEAWNKIGIINMIVAKLERYCAAMARGEDGHIDSAHDIIVYAAMLEELTRESSNS